MRVPRITALPLHTRESISTRSKIGIKVPHVPFSIVNDTSGWVRTQAWVNIRISRCSDKFGFHDLNAKNVPAAWQQIASSPEPPKSKFKI